MADEYVKVSDIRSLDDLEEVDSLLDSDKLLISRGGVTNSITIANSIGNKVDKVTGKSLVSDSDITQITTNKDNITNLQTTVGDSDSGLVKQVNDLDSVVGNVNDLLSTI